jgi:hypothetical protein
LIVVWRFRGGWWAHGLLGLTAALAATFELPAAGWLAMCCLLALIRSVHKTVWGTIPAAVAVAIPFLATNYWAHGTWKPAYDFRSDGPLVEEIDGDFADELNQGLLPPPLLDLAERHSQTIGFRLAASAPVVEGSGISADPAVSKRWIVNRDRPDQLVVTLDSRSGRYAIRRWGNWYDFEGSYWLDTNDRKSNVDRGEIDPVKYLFHMTVGHHGVLSLSPVFLLSLLGIPLLVVSQRYAIRLIAWGTLATTVVVFVFYVTRPAIDRNYGGMTSGLRWVFWLYPLWLMWMIPAVDFAVNRRLFRGIVLVLLAASVISAAMAADNPWTHPWLYQVLGSWGVSL